MMKQDITKVSVELNALCYALWQAEDCIPVVFLEAEYDAEVHFKQVQLLARVCSERYHASSAEAQGLCYQWDPRIDAIAKCETLEEYKQL